MRYNLRNATFKAACAQGVYDATERRFGLRQPGWVIERLLIVAEDPSVGPVAAWVEGIFVLTNRGLGAISIARVEAPRPGHSDLELATCDLSVGWQGHDRLGMSHPETH